jgi:pimeloyl-ACP methyl ester carboxylesterase
VRHTVHTGDGRLLAVEDRGDPAGRPVLIHHGTPSSRWAACYGPWVSDAAARGLRLISFDRPGYGQSSPRQSGTVADTVADVRAICAELAIERLVTWGFSGGGPHALACAALLPELVAAAGSVAGPAPFDAEGLDWFAGQHRDDAEDNRLFLADPAAARRKQEEEREEYLNAPAGTVVVDGGPALPPDGVDVGPGEFQEYMLSCTKAGLAPGGLGWWSDTRMRFLPWGFNLADIAVPVLLMHGRKDISVPPAHGEWLAGRIPGVQVRWFDEGHATIAQHGVPELHAWLAEQR